VNKGCYNHICWHMKEQINIHSGSYIWTSVWTIYLGWPLLKQKEVFLKWYHT
jgi:hypothetical protein